MMDSLAEPRVGNRIWHHGRAAPPASTCSEKDMASELKCLGDLSLSVRPGRTSVVYLRDPARRSQRDSAGCVRGGGDSGQERIDDLVGDFVAMAARIESLITDQRQLISDVSYEFGSLLVRINLAIKLVRKAESPAVTTVIARIEEESNRLNAMVESLLTLSSTDGGGLLRPETAPGPRGNGTPERIAVGDLEMNMGDRTVKCSGKRIELTALEFNLLELFLRSAGRVVTREEAAETVWGRPFSGVERTIDIHISKL